MNKTLTIELNYEKNILNCKLTSSDKNYSKFNISHPMFKKYEITFKNPNHQGLFNNIMSLQNFLFKNFIKNCFEKKYSIFNSYCAISLKTRKPLDEPLPTKGFSTAPRAQWIGPMIWEISM